MENEERNYSIIITFEGLTEAEANMMLEEFPALEDSIKEDISKARINIERRLLPDGSTKVSH